MGNYDIGKDLKVDLTTLPTLPKRTEEDTGYIGASVQEVMDDPTLNKEQKANAVRGTLSDKGEKYDPQIHSYPPRETLTGRWKKRRVLTSQKAAGIIPNAEYRKAAENAANLYATMNHVIFGEGAEKDKTALGPVVDAFESLYMERGIQKLPTWASMIVGLSSYTFTVASKPKPRSKVKGWFKRALLYFGLEWEEDETTEKQFDERTHTGHVEKKGWFGD